MNVSDRGLAIIKKFEGCRLKAYKDSVGVWTIGYGHTIGVFEGMKISQHIADQFLLEDCQKVVNYLNGTDMKWTQSQFDALVSFGFNCGVGNLRKLITNRDYKTIAEMMLKYKYAGGRVLKGLENRRKEEQELFLSDETKKMEEELLHKALTYVTVDGDKTVALNVRKEPNKSAEVIAVINAGTECQIDTTKDTEEYYYVPKFDGYIMKSFCKAKE